MSTTNGRFKALALSLILAPLLALGCAARATSQPASEKNAGANRATADAPTPAADGTSGARGTPAGADAGSATSAPPSQSTTAGATAAATVAPAAAVTADWPQWRGPNRDGSVPGAVAPRAWPKELREQWRVTVGVGHSSPVVSEGRVFQFARQGDDEVLTAFDAATGKQLWQSEPSRVDYEMNPAARGHGKGPKSTPVIAAGRVFTLGITGVLSAHDAKTGRLVWRKDFSKQYPTTSPLYGTAMSPVVEKGLLIAHVGGHDKGSLAAFDAATGAVKWSYDADGPAYSSPVILNVGGERQLVTFTQREFVGLSAATGKLLWKLPAKTHYDTNCNTAVAYKDTVIASLEGQGVLAFRPARQGANWTAQEVWRNTEHELYMNSPVLHAGVLVGLSARKKGQFFALDADTGKTLWQGPGRAGENASILNLSGTLLALTNDANLIVLPAAAKEYAPLAQLTVATSPTWAHPVFLGDRILVKDETTLASLALR